MDKQTLGYIAREIKKEESQIISAIHALVEGQGQTLSTVKPSMKSLVKGDDSNGDSLLVQEREEHIKALELETSLSEKHKLEP